jgi:hypothetical protein
MASIRIRLDPNESIPIVYRSASERVINMLKSKFLRKKISKKEKKIILMIN